MQDKSSRRSNAQRTAEMRLRLIATARRLFAEKGFAETGTPEIVREADVTRGALYHHFEDKTALFKAVAEEEAKAVEKEINASTEASPDASNAMEEGTRAYFRAMSVPGRARILLMDGPAILGVAEMDRIDAGGGRAALRTGLSNLRPDLSETQVEALTVTLSAAYDRAALEIVSGGDVATYERVMGGLVSGLSR